MSVNFSEIGGAIPPRSEQGFSEPPEITVINKQGNSVTNNENPLQSANVNQNMQPTYQPPPIKITPPPPRFVQGTTAPPMPAFTVLGAGKMVYQNYN